MSQNTPSPITKSEPSPKPSPKPTPRQNPHIIRPKSLTKQNPQPRGKSASNWRPLPNCPKAPSSSDPHAKTQPQPQQPQQTQPQQPQPQRKLVARSSGNRPQSLIGLRASQPPPTTQKVQAKGSPASPASPGPKSQSPTNLSRPANTSADVDQNLQANMTSSPQLQRSAPPQTTTNTNNTAGGAGGGLRNGRVGSASFGMTSSSNQMTSSDTSSGSDGSGGETTSTPWGPMIPGCSWKKKIVPWNPSTPQGERRINVALQRQKSQNISVSPSLARSLPAQPAQAPSSPTPITRSANPDVNTYTNNNNNNNNMYNNAENVAVNDDVNKNVNNNVTQEETVQQYNEQPSTEVIEQQQPITTEQQQQYEQQQPEQQPEQITETPEQPTNTSDTTDTNVATVATTETTTTTTDNNTTDTTDNNDSNDNSNPEQSQTQQSSDANESSKSVSPAPEGLGTSPTPSSISSSSGTSKKHSKKEEAELERAHACLDKIRQINPAFFEKAEDVEVKSIGNCALWVPDSASDKCMMCGKTFGTLTRRHHCRQCGRLLCGDCSSWKMGTSRACPECFCSYVESGGAQTLFAGGGGSSRVLIQEDDAAADKEEEERAAAAAAAEEEEKKRKAEEAAALLPADKEERLRYKCVQEIITTEKTYAEQLNTLINVYLFPIKMTGILNPEQVNGIFSNVETIEPVHQELIKNLTDDDYTKGGEYIGEAFKKMCQYLKMYTIYCANHEHAIEMIESLKSNAEFQKTLSICQTDYRTKGENLGSFIIKPVQRICKYPLLFRELISHTPETHPDYNLLIETKAKIDDVVKAINEGKRRMEQQQKMIEILNSVDGTFEGEGLITPSRVWIADYKVKGKSLLGSSKMIDYTLYLFNDLLMITRSSSSGKKQPLKAFIPIMDAVFTVISDTDKEKNCFEVSYKNHKSTFKFFLDSEARRDTITKELKTTQKEFQKKIFSGKIIKSGGDK